MYECVKISTGKAVSRRKKLPTIDGSYAPPGLDKDLKWYKIVLAAQPAFDFDKEVLSYSRTLNDTTKEIEIVYTKVAL